MNLTHIPLARRVLVVAATYEDGTWAAYVDAVAGIDHYEERDDVAMWGAKLDANHARHLFPRLALKPYSW